MSNILDRKRSLPEIERSNRERIMSFKRRYECLFNDDFKIIFNHRGIYLKDHKDYTLINLLDDKAVEKTKDYIKDYLNLEEIYE